MSEESELKRRNEALIDVLLIGGRGNIGSGFRTYLPKLDPDYVVTSLDLPGAKDKATAQEAHRHFLDLDIQEDDDGLRRALEGRDLVVYLARTGELGPMNRMTDQVFQAVMDVCPSAMVIGSSSVHATGGAYFPFDKEPFSSIAARAFDGVDPWPRLSARLEPCPTGDYGLTKAYVEAWCQRLGAIGQSAVAARWGGINARNAMTEEVAYFTVWCHQEDAAQFVDGCFKAHRNGTLRSGAHYYVISDNTYSIFDIETAREEVGYTPVHDAEALVTR
ncbi:hypothetical protein MK139_12145 [bacterium]|nr:hypothetical protein [bacterium]